MKREMEVPSSTAEGETQGPAGSCLPEKESLSSPKHTTWPREGLQGGPVMIRSGFVIPRLCVHADVTEF